MKLMNKNRSLTANVWSYLTLFSIAILGFLWLFQIVFLDKYYEYYKTKDLIKAAEYVNSNYQNNGITNMDIISHDYGVCVEIFDTNNIIYSSNMFSRGCMLENRNYMDEFINSDLSSKTYKLDNSRLGNKTLIYATNIDGVYTFVSASLQPLDATTSILKSQFITVTIIVLILSFVIAYFISKRIANPIVKINEEASKMSKGEYDIKFDENSSIEEINELARTLNHTSEELNKIEELRSDLLANVSHDLKTPLTMIKAYAEMVRDLTYKDDLKRTDNLNVIIEESDRLNVLVNDILTLTKLENTETKLEVEEFDLNELINSILRRYDILVNEGYNFVYKNKKSVIIKADKKRLEQVIYNLINNAVNYTGEDKTVTINIKDNKNNYRVEVIDTGNGIEEKDLPYIWDKYYHSKKKHKRNVIGTGVGLSIVKNILNNHNYKYGVESKLNKGSNFYFEIPKELK
ncbi:MAG: HAMP domain-containing histidine kinase [Bacilli bacterium]|nr:HAMP domain-containing histidine kinase [Bacilli bacterium]